MESVEKKWYQNVEWTSAIFLLVTPVLALILGIYYLYNFGFSWALLALMTFYYFATGMSITAGYHRLFSHRTYEASLPVRLFYLFFGAAAFQNSVITWCTDHRYHHKYTDSDNDPYNAKRGFWFSHIGWMLTKESPVDDRVGNLITRDLQKDPWVKFQHDFYIPIAAFSSFGVPTLIGWSFGEPLGAFIFAGLVRMALVHHYTFFINSLAHIWGRQTYGKANTAKDNAFISLFTYGEGYHNFHHHFQNDYRNGIRWYDYDPTKWLICSASFVGLAGKLKRTPEQEIILARVSQQTSEALSDQKSGWEPYAPRLEQLRERIDQCASQLKELQDDYNQLKKRLATKKDLRLAVLKRDIKVAKRELRLRYYHWRSTLSQLEKFGPQALPS
ncbi:MAG: fatty acid desaturase [Bdellovibrionales bacterium]|nr:fatty acid desaturase [Bdellovibrionales bacterium]